ncbi:hypothetical protein P9112_012431 [Eukaryota sp. TZLM1-RC]
MSNLSASLINGSVGQDINSNPPERQNIPPTQKSNFSLGKSSSSFEKSNPLTRRILLLKRVILLRRKKSHLPNKESGKNNDDVTELYTYSNNYFEPLPCRKSFFTLSEQRKYKTLANTNNSNVCTEGEKGEGEQQSKTSPLHKTPSSPPSDTISSEVPQNESKGTEKLDNSRKGDENDDEPPHTPNPYNPTPSFSPTERTSQRFYCRELAMAVEAVTRDIQLNLIANPSDDVMDWSDDKLLQMAENEAKRFSGDVDPAES